MKRAQKKKGRVALGPILLLLALCLLSGCAVEGLDTERSPRLVGHTISAHNEGGEDSQYVTLLLQFDREILLRTQQPNSLRITIGGNRVKSSECALEAVEDEVRVVRLTIPTRAATNGKLNIEPLDESLGCTEIIAADGSYRHGHRIYFLVICENDLFEES